MSITRINEFKAAEGKSAELFEFLGSLLPHINSSEGSLSCELLRSDESEDSFVVIERWESKEFHRKSVDSFPKEEMQGAMSLFGAPPKGAYYHP
ncbi:putative quinol monooxygenase [Aliikangiella coralliicola]|uniref:Antibiotic biosynthesis monooxygenase n=1 Tax=Aliikangiella coralliicola TaxID=2592383 RepID=A0A545UJH8_9GAMM|nr:antibiotic biosynthesis monooxygenase family protein [Aliikangiella coralliicola]TQV89593.1 antibiotic biosynthesis monooxygenase [Aliikangiella coralliicola]